MTALGRNLAAALALPLLAGCAYVTAVPAPPGSNIEGIRIYEVKPILIVNDQSVTIQMIPNYNRAYALRFGAFLAKNDMQVDFENGFVSHLKSNQDSTAIIELFKSIVEATPQIAGAFSGQNAAGGATGRFGVFEFIFDDQGNLVGLRPLLHPDELMRLPAVAAGGAVAAVPTAPAVAAKPKPGTTTVDPPPK